ncbi:MAG: hypothetical protein GY863_15375 [bacterium]|nr:hypothetical protein [bacterium]
MNIFDAVKIIKLITPEIRIKDFSLVFRFAGECNFVWRIDFILYGYYLS